ncbi:MAG: replicative DNA helicase [Syntrophaceae bacterium]|nr:replicative DNA helicase [Syntrophaceae bacterium]
MKDANTSLHKVPPQNLEAEQAVLGGILLDNDALNTVLEVLGSPGTSDFYSEAHRKIFSAIVELREQREVPADLITLGDLLKNQNRIEQVGGMAYLASLVDNVSSAANIAFYAKIIKEKSIRRHLIGTATEIINRSFESGSEVDTVLDQAEQAIFDISENKIRNSFFPIKEIVKESFKTIERIYNRKELLTGVATGFKKLDELTSGLQNSDLIIIGGRPSMGKTAFALNIAQNVALNGVPVAVFSLEMSKEQLGNRMLAAEARVDFQRLRTGFLGETDWPKLTKAADKLSEAPIHIDDTPAITVIEMKAKARRLKREHGLGLIVLDYLQLMHGGAFKDSREQEISEISRSLKALAKELDLPVIALSQLNRKVEDRGGKGGGHRPQMADLRESGAIEQDADVIAFIYRDEFYNRSDDNRNKGIAEVIVAKQRNGPTDTVKLAFQAQFTRFENLAHTDGPS